MDAALLPIYLGIDISNHLLSLKENGLSDVEYENVAIAIGYLTTTKKQEKFAELLMSLPRPEIISRTTKISKLVKTLSKIKTKPTT